MNFPTERLVCRLLKGQLMSYLLWKPTKDRIGRDTWTRKTFRAISKRKYQVSDKIQRLYYVDCVHHCTTTHYTHGISQQWRTRCVLYLLLVFR